jgi:hypothetical protein
VLLKWNNGATGLVTFSIIDGTLEDNRFFARFSPENGHQQRAVYHVFAGCASRVSGIYRGKGRLWGCEAGARGDVRSEHLEAGHTGQAETCPGFILLVALSGF